VAPVAVPGTVLFLGLIPLAGFGAILMIVESPSQSATIGRLLLFVLVVAAMISILLAYLLAADLTGPLRAIAAAVDRVSAGDLSTPIEVPGEDELARLADSHNRLAATLERRNRELGRILAAIEQASPRDGAEFAAGRAATDARAAFGMIDCDILLVDPINIPTEERIPGDPLPVRAVLQIGGEAMGVLVGHLPATRTWERADQDLLELFASEVAVAIRNAELFARVEAQNSQLLELDAAKDDFLRGVSHNLQTPLTSIRLALHLLLAHNLGFTPSGMSWHGPSWSISVEFYCPLLLFFWIGLWRDNRNASFVTPTVILAVVCVLAIFNGARSLDVHYQNLNVWANYGVLRCLAEAATGLLVYRCYQAYGTSRAPGRAGATAAEILLLVLISTLLFRRSFTSPDDVLIIPLFAALVFLLATSRGWVAQVLLLPPLRWLGRLSYSIYINHFLVVMSLSLVIFKPWWLYFGLVLALSWATYHGIEAPARRAINRRLGQHV
jgi:HAMP domain-containing protein